MGGREESGKIFVGGLSWDTDQDSLQGYFGQFGEITDCIVMMNQQTGKSRGFGFVSFKDSSTVQVILSSKSHVIDGRTVDAKACNARGTTPKAPNKYGGGSGGGGGGGGMTGRTTKIFIGGLPNNVREDTIRDSFSRFGNVTEVVIMYDHEKERSRGFGFLTFDNEDSVEQACAEHYVDVNGKQVECKKAEPRGAAGGGRGGGSGGRGGGRGGGNSGGYGGGSQGWGQGGPQSNWNQGGWNQDGYNQQAGWNQQPAWNQGGGYNNGWQQGTQQGQPSMGYGGGYGQYQQQGGYGDQQQQQGGYGQQQGGYGQQQGGYGSQQGGQQSSQGMGGSYQQRQAPGNTGGSSSSSGGRGSGSQNYHPYSR